LGFRRGLERGKGDPEKRQAVVRWFAKGRKLKQIGDRPQQGKRFIIREKSLLGN